MSGGGDDIGAMQAAVFGAVAEGVAEALLGLLGPSLGNGLVIDVACGVGLVVERIAAAGYAVRGGDISAEMVALARQRVPDGRFARGSIFDVDLAPARAIVAVGEAVSRQCPPGDASALETFVHRAHQALERGGILLFDAAAPGRGGARGFAQGEGWTIGTTCAEEDGATLIRTMTLFTPGENGWDRHVREERLSLWTREQIDSVLDQAGFTVEAGGSYGRLVLPNGLIRYTAQK